MNDSSKNVHRADIVHSHHYSNIRLINYKNSYLGIAYYDLCAWRKGAVEMCP